MNILVINASPKGTKSSTMRITKAFISGFKNAKTDIINLADININPCKGCFGCWSISPGKCVINDDMSGIYGKIAESDVIIESFPLYFFGIPSTLKNLTDRCLPYTKAYGWQSAENKTFCHEMRDSNMYNKKLVLISGCWHSGIEKMYSSVKKQYDMICGDNCYSHIFCAQGKLFEIDAKLRQVTAYLDAVKKAGAEFENKRCIPETIQKSLDRPILSDATFEKITRPYWTIKTE